jgi:hypothetical protein
MRTALFTAAFYVFTVAFVAGVAEAQQCAQPVTSGANPTASDCLYILKTAVGSQTCAPECVCAPKGTLPTTAVDALLCLKKAVGQGVTLNCPCTGTTVTTSPTSTTTTITTPTTTSTPTSTIGGGNIALGRQDYDDRCSFCHAAGSHDPDAEFAGDLAGKGDNLVSDLGTIDGSMSGIMMSDPEIANMAAFLDSLK